MDVIHFTHGATDPLTAFDAHGGECHVSCAHLDPGAKIPAPSLTHAVAPPPRSPQRVRPTLTYRSRLDISPCWACNSACSETQ